MYRDAIETELLAAIVADPDALEPRLIYADWLQARSDPRGELIVVQAARREHPDDVQLEVRERELTEALTAALIAETAAEPLQASTIARWHLGFVDALAIGPREIRLLRTTHRAWAARPVFAAVRELEIRSRFARNLRVVRQLGLTEVVRRLTIGVTDRTLDEATLAAIVTRMPRLTALRLRTDDVPPLAPLRALSLRELALEVGTLTDDGIGRIADMPWALDRFGLRTQLMFPPDRYPALARLYDGSALAGVKHVVVGATLPVVQVLETIATSKRAATLASFTGDFYRVPYDELQRIERHREALAGLKIEAVLGANAYIDVDNCTKVAALLNYRLDRPAEALPYYERGLRLRPDNSSLRHNYGVALRKLGRLDESLVAFDTIIAQSKKPTAGMYNGRHYTLCELGRRAEARADLERALAIDPSYADVWNNLGVERQYAGDADGALAAFRRCMELDPQHRYALRNEADLLLELERAAEAIPIYERLRAAAPGDRALPPMLAQAQLVAGAYADARATLDARFADPLQERGERLHSLRALALTALGEGAAAAADLDAFANLTECPAWFALALTIRGLEAWRRVVPDTAITPQAIADAVTAHGRAHRPADAAALHDANADDQMDCAELGVAAALYAGDRELAVARARAVAALYAEQGPRFFRKWWQVMATALAVLGRELDDDARALLSLVIRAVRGRARIAEVLTLA